MNLLHIWTILEVHLGKPPKKITTESLINASYSYYLDNCPIFCGCFLKASLCWLLTSLWSTLGFIDRYFKSNSILFLSFVNLPLWATLFLHLTFQLMWSLCCQKYSSKSKYSLHYRHCSYDSYFSFGPTLTTRWCWLGWGWCWRLRPAPLGIRRSASDWRVRGSSTVYRSADIWWWSLMS